jgi:hypothetical protein
VGTVASAAEQGADERADDGSREGLEDRACPEAEVLVDVAGVGYFRLATGERFDGVDEQAVEVFPASVDGRPLGACPSGHTVDGEAAVAAFDELGDGGVEDRGADAV